MTDAQRAENRRLVEAAAWLVHLSENDAGDGEFDEEFQRWLRHDPENAAAWRQVHRPWQLVGEHATSPEILVARKAALSRAHAVSRRRWRDRPWLRSRVVQSIAASVVAVVAIALLTWQQRPEFDVYSTGTNTRRIVTLEDGSTLALDAESEVRVHYSRSARELLLLRGQAQFAVAHDATRPFGVTAGSRKIVATGTSFNIDLLATRLAITLIEGRVKVVPQLQDSWLQEKPNAQLAKRERIDLLPGQQLIVGSSGVQSVATVPVDQATAWRSGRIVFENETLADAVARLNRYSKRPLIIGDAATAARRITGVFNSDDIDGFIRTITAYLPVSAQLQPDGDIALKSIAPPAIP